MVSVLSNNTTRLICAISHSYLHYNDAFLRNVSFMALRGTPYNTKQGSDPCLFSTNSNSHSPTEIIS